MRLLPILLALVTTTLAMDAASPSKTLPGTSWTVTSMAGQPVLEGHPVTFEFDAEGNITGHGSCNGFGGSCEIGDGTLKVGPLRSTRRACEPDIMKQEHTFLSLLGSATAWIVQENMLVLTSPEGEIRAEPRAAE